MWESYVQIADTQNGPVVCMCAVQLWKLSLEWEKTMEDIIVTVGHYFVEKKSNTLNFNM